MLWTCASPDVISAALAPAGIQDQGNIRMISAETYNSFNLQSNGTVSASGDNSLGQTSELAGQPEPVKAIKIAAGINHSLALTTDGKVVGWGLNYYGQTNVKGGVNPCRSHCRSRELFLSITGWESFRLGRIFEWSNECSKGAIRCRLHFRRISSFLSIEKGRYRCRLGV